MPVKKTTAKRKTVTPRTTKKVAKAESAAVAAVNTAVTAVMAAPTPVVAAPVVASPVVETVAPPAAEIVAEAVVATALVEAVSVEDHTAVLIDQLQAADADRAVDAAAELGKLDTAEGRAALVAVLANENGYFHTVTRSAAALALGQSADASVSAALHLAAQDEVAEVSREAILSLGRLKVAASASLLMRIAENPTGFYVDSARHAAVRALGMIPALEARELLARLALSEDRAIAVAADEALRGM
jgi:HEAT repeat protein